MNLNKIFSSAINELSEAGIKTAEIDAKVLLRTVLNKDDVYLISHSDELITNAQYQKLRRYIRRRKKGEPVAYIIGHKEFYGLDFTVNKNVLIPRPETEVLIDQALTYLQTILPINRLTGQPVNIIDIGTGSGCIIISLIKNLPTAIRQPLAFFASDISQKALNTAKKNAEIHEVYDKIRFFKSDLFSNPRLPDKFNLIIANLPYLNVNHYKDNNHSSGTVGLNYEPIEALFAKNNGFLLIHKLIFELPRLLADNGLALIETAEFHKPQIIELAQKLGLAVESIENSSDYNGYFKICRD